MKKYADWKSFRTGLRRSALTPNIPNIVTAPHAKIFPRNPPDQKFYMAYTSDRGLVYESICISQNGAFEKYCTCVENN